MTTMILLREWQASQIEFWRQIPGFPGYDVSNFGRIRSYWIKVVNKGRGKGFRSEMSNASHYIKSTRNHNGYPCVRRLGGQLVHRLVARAFLGNPQNLSDVDHLNCVKYDARLGNLERVAHIENMRRARAAGLRDGVLPCGEAHHGCRVSDATVLEMQKLYGEGIKPPTIARRFSITLGNAYDLAQGRRGRGRKLKEKHDGNFTR